MSDKQEGLGQLREQIDDVDSKLLELLNRRARLAQEVGEHKRSVGGSFYRPDRERELIDRLKSENSGPFPQSAIRPVFQEVVSACLSLEASIQVAYLGPEATFTHQAVRRHFGTSAQSLPCGTIDAVFEEVEKGHVAFGVVPVENSSEGVVNHTLDCFLDRELHVAAEIVVSIEHCLLAQKGVNERDIQRVYSHPQALAQCRTWLSKNLRHATLVQSPSTADAARAAQGDHASAAVSAALAARMYGLEILRRHLQDSSDNVTRFLVVAKDQQEVAVDAEGVKTSLLLTLPDRHGALLEVLTHFDAAEINLNKIESRPSKQKAWDYVFFLDFDGHRADPKVAEVLEGLSKSCDLFKVLGTYRKADPL